MPKTIQYTFVEDAVRYRPGRDDLLIVLMRPAFMGGDVIGVPTTQTALEAHALANGREVWSDEDVVAIVEQHFQGIADEEFGPGVISIEVPLPENPTTTFPEDENVAQ